MSQSYSYWVLFLEHIKGDPKIFKRCLIDLNSKDDFTNLLSKYFNQMTPRVAELSVHLYYQHGTYWMSNPTLNANKAWVWLLNNWYNETVATGNQPSGTQYPLPHTTYNHWRFVSLVVKQIYIIKFNLSFQNKLKIDKSW